MKNGGSWAQYQAREGHDCAMDGLRTRSQLEMEFDSDIVDYILQLGHSYVEHGIWF